MHTLTHAPFCSLVRFLFDPYSQALFKLLQVKIATCPFEENDQQCTGKWYVRTPEDGSMPFVGCTMWKAGDPRTCEGGHNACYLRDGVDPELLEQYRTDGAPAGVVEGGTCTFIAPKCHKGKVCHRHGGEDPPLERAGNGSAFPVRARLLHPTFIKDASNIRVILLLFNKHNHVYHVCKPSGAAILDAIETHPDASICSLQVRTLDYIFFRLPLSFLFLSLPLGLAVFLSIFEPQILTDTRTKTCL